MLFIKLNILLKTLHISFEDSCRSMVVAYQDIVLLLSVDVLLRSLAALVFSRQGASVPSHISSCFADNCQRCRFVIAR